MQKLVLSLGLTLLVAAAFVACGGDDDDDAAGSGTPGAVATGGTRPTEAPDKPPIIIGEATVLESGVQILEIRDGTGRFPAREGSVLVHFTGWLSLFGPQFDSTLNAGDPKFVTLTETIPGFAEGIIGMREGGHRRIIVPPDQAYGEEGFADLVPPSTTLIFDVELIEVLPPGATLPSAS